MLDQLDKEMAARALEEKEAADHRSELQEKRGLQTLAERLQAHPMSIILAAKVLPSPKYIIGFCAHHESFF